MTNTTCTELYNDMIENTYDLLCDICVIEALYRCRASLPRFTLRPALGEEFRRALGEEFRRALGEEFRRARDFLEQHARDTESCGRFLLDRLATEAGIEKEPS